MPIKDPIKRRENQRQWRLKNKDKMREQQRRYRKKYPEKVREKANSWRKNNPEKSYLIQKKYRDNNKKRFREYEKIRNLKRFYNITLEDYERLLKSQNNQCLICKIFFTRESGFRSGCVDHCHETGKLRGILCGSCNSLLGYAKDDIMVLTEAIKYLKTHGKS